MLTLQTILLAFMLGVPTPQAVLRGLLAPPASAPVTNTYTKVQSVMFDCPASSLTCAPTITASGAGHAITVLAGNFQTSQVTISSVTDSAGSSYTVPAGCSAYIAAAGSINGAYTLNSIAGATTVTITWSAAPQSGVVEVIEASGTSAPQFDQCSGTILSNQTNPKGITITPAASSEYIFQSIVPSSSCTAITSPYTTPVNFDTGKSGSGFAGAINTASGAQPTWTCPGPDSFGELVLALK